MTTSSQGKNQTIDFNSHLLPQRGDQHPPDLVPGQDHDVHFHPVRRLLESPGQRIPLPTRSGVRRSVVGSLLPSGRLLAHIRPRLGLRSRLWNGALHLGIGHFGRYEIFRDQQCHSTAIWSVERNDAGSVKGSNRGCGCRLDFCHFSNVELAHILSHFISLFYSCTVSLLFLLSLSLSLPLSLTTSLSLTSY